MKDNFGRTIDYLRISLTDRCNLRCSYCMPAEGVEMMNHKEILSLEEIIRIAEISVDLGVSKIRLTGGEPLVRKGVTSLISRLKSVKGIENISMTTNGILLENMAYELKRCGLDRLNISLDTVDKLKFKKISRVDGLDKVKKGIETAISAGFDPIKLNTVAVKGLNDDEILNLADYAVTHGLILRFIEQMPFTGNDKDSYMPASEIIELLTSEYGDAELLKESEKKNIGGNGPASIYFFKKKKLVAGFITPVSNHFCSSCNRLRITADGKLKLCLLSDEEIDIKSKLRDGSSNIVIKSLLRSSLKIKPEKHNLKSGLFIGERGMSKIGG